MEIVSKTFIFSYLIIKGLTSKFIITFLNVLSGTWFITWVTDFLDFFVFPIEILLIPPIVITVTYIARILSKLFLINRL